MKTKLAALSVLLLGCQNQASQEPAEPMVDVETPEVIKELVEPAEIIKENNSDLTVGSTMREATASVSYYNPSGKVDYDIIFTIEDDIIRDFRTTHDPNDKHQQKREENLKKFIIDQKIDEINIPARINGSSLTSPAWEKAIKNLQDS